MDVKDYKLTKECRIYSGWMNNGKVNRFIKNGCQPIDDNGTQLRFYLSKNGVLYYRRENRVSHYVQTVLENFGTTETNKYMLEDMGFTFDYPKPVELISYLLKLFVPKNGIVLDFFAGSGTTGHAALNLLVNEKMKLQFILCTNNVKNICSEITYPRIKTLITGKKIDGSEYSIKLPANLKYYKTDFISKVSSDHEYFIEDALMEHIIEMIQLENGVCIDNNEYIVLLDDDAVEEFEKKFADYHPKKIYVDQTVFLSKNIKDKLEADGVEILSVPDYYFAKDVKGELK